MLRLLQACLIIPGEGVRPPSLSAAHSSIRSAPPFSAANADSIDAAHASSLMLVFSIKYILVLQSYENLWLSSFVLFV